MTSNSISTQQTDEATDVQMPSPATNRPGKTIVVGVHRSDEHQTRELAEAVLEVAGPTNATVHAVHVFTPTEYDRTLGHLNFDADYPPKPDTVAARHGGVRQVADRLTDPDREYSVPVEPHGRVADDVGPTLVDVADAVSADRVIVGGRSRSAVGKAVFGDTAQHVLANAPCPVTFVRTR